MLPWPPLPPEKRPSREARSGDPTHVLRLAVTPRSIAPSHEIVRRETAEPVRVEILAGTSQEQAMELIFRAWVLCRETWPLLTLPRGAECLANELTASGVDIRFPMDRLLKGEK